MLLLLKSGRLPNFNLPKPLLLSTSGLRPFLKLIGHSSAAWNIQRCRVRTCPDAFTSNDHFTIVMWSFYNHFMIILQSSKDYLTFILGLSPHDQFTIMIRLSYDHLMIILYSS
jgi:hypothetical protein